MSISYKKKLVESNYNSNKILYNKIKGREIKLLAPPATQSSFVDYTVIIILKIIVN